MALLRNEYLLRSLFVVLVFLIVVVLRLSLTIDKVGDKEGLVFLVVLDAQPSNKADNT